MGNVQKRLHEQLGKRQKSGNLRSLKLIDNLVDFSSNDYLGLAGSDELRSAIDREYHRHHYRIGSTGSRLLTGNSPVYVNLEKALAKFFKAPAALVFNSGYTANLALLSTLPQRGDTILYDQLVHACIKEGARLSKAKFRSFRHNHPDDLEIKLRNSTGNKFVVIESLYSMEGDYAPIMEIAEICREHQAEIIIDEAHTSGWAGPGGRGWAVENEAVNSFIARVYTFGKGFGAFGACVTGSRELIDYLINYSRPFIYTTALPHHCVVTLMCALNYIEQQSAPGAELYQRISHYLEVVEKLAIPGSRNDRSPVQWIPADGNKQARQISDHLASKGFDARPILSPTVPEGKERIRICIHSFNTHQQISDLLTAVAHS